MKPLHIGLLIVGAALAGGLAMRMTDLQPVQPVPVASSAVPVVADPAPVLKAAPASEPAVEAVPLKPSPMPRRFAPAPAPVYVAPVHVEPTHLDQTRLEPTHVEPVHVEQAAPKSKPVLIAKTAPLPPLLPPVPYEPPPQPEQQAAAPVPEPTPPAPQRTANLPAGMTVAVRLNESLSSERGIAGDTFNASLSEPLVVGGLVIAERGAHARGRILGTQRAGRVNGTSSLDLELTMVETSDGQKIEISTVPWTKRGDTIYSVNGSAAVSRGKPVNVPTETVIRFRLASRVTITERQL
jgi:hypothetical protein